MVCSGVSSVCEVSVDSDLLALALPRASFKGGRRGAAAPLDKISPPWQNLTPLETPIIQ